MSALVDPVLYNSVPSLEKALFRRAGFEEHVPPRPKLPIYAESYINSAIRDVFLKHDAHNSFCLYLMHRNHEVSADETIVKVNGKVRVMDSHAVAEVVSSGNEVVPTTWMSADDRILPMEYTVVPVGTVTPVPSEAFLSELIDVLKSKGCSECSGLGKCSKCSKCPGSMNCFGMFGIDSIAKADWAKMSIRNKSVIVPSDTINSHDRRKFWPVAFVFEEGNPRHRVHGICAQDHEYMSKRHFDSHDYLSSTFTYRPH